MDVLTSLLKEKRLNGRAAVKVMDVMKIVRRVEECMMGERWMGLYREGSLIVPAMEGWRTRNSILPHDAPTYLS